MIFQKSFKKTSPSKFCFKRYYSSEKHFLEKVHTLLLIKVLPLIEGVAFLSLVLRLLGEPSCRKFHYLWRSDNIAHYDAFVHYFIFMLF